MTKPTTARKLQRRKQNSSPRKPIRKELRLQLDEWQLLQKAAQHHHQRPTVFIRKAALAYVNGVYLLPDDEQLQHFNACLQQAAMSIHAIADQSPSLEDTQVQQLFDLLVSIEHSLHQIFHQPPQLKQLIQEIIDHHPKLHQWALHQLQTLSPSVQA